MNERFIKTNNTKKIKLLLIFAIFIMLAMLLLKLPRYANIDKEEEMLIQVVSAATISLFLFLSIIVIVRMNRKKSGIYLSERGIQDNVFRTNSNFIAWQDIENILTHSDSEKAFILIFLHNPTGFIEGATGMRKQLFLMNNKAFGTPVSIIIDELNMEAKELHELLIRYLDKYGAE